MKFIDLAHKASSILAAIGAAGLTGELFIPQPYLNWILIIAGVLGGSAVVGNGGEMAAKKLNPDG